ncbi:MULTISPECIES: hypothetical protein [unclassified Lysobacter]|uniref:hypothetical protein n=1 Tax=unclassified Lysobacter TaxID=2635362 RepID=UPI001C21FD61|nr:hypothetical protein [Lysobacter sp. MMG2]MBU8976417.1 hypothetical protein [Lysobacter sp. MMG2]
MEKSAERNVLIQDHVTVGFDVVNRDGILNGYACSAPFVIGSMAGEPTRESVVAAREAPVIS